MEAASRLALGDLHGIDAGVVNGEPPVKVGASDAAGGADFADLLRQLYGLLGMNIDFGEVSIEGVNTIAMIDHDGVTGVVEIFGEDHLAGLGGEDGRAGCGGKVDAGMRRTRFPIENAAAAEIPSRGHVVKGQTEFSGPETFGSNGVVDGAHFLLVVGGALLLFGIGLDELFFNFEMFGRKFAGADGDDQGARLGFAGRIRPRHFPLVFSRRFFQVNADEAVK